MEYRINQQRSLDELVGCSILQKRIVFHDWMCLCIRIVHIPFLLHDQVEELLLGAHTRFEAGIEQHFLERVLQHSNLRAFKIIEALSG